MLSTPPAATAAELTEKRMFMLFPTPMFMGKLPDMSVCDRVEKKVRELQKSGKGRAAPKGASPRLDVAGRSLRSTRDERAR